MPRQSEQITWTWWRQASEPARLLTYYRDMRRNGYSASEARHLARHNFNLDFSEIDPLLQAVSDRDTRSRKCPTTHHN